MAASKHAFNNISNLIYNKPTVVVEKSSKLSLAPKTIIKSANNRSAINIKEQARPKSSLFTKPMLIRKDTMVLGKSTNDNKGMYF